MPRNSGGTYSLPTNSFAQPVINTAIDPAAAIATYADWTSEITDSVSRSGKGALLANIAAGGFKFTGLGAGTTNGDSVRYEQLLGLLDTYSTTQGSILYRGAAGWAALGPGTLGDILQSNGAGANPSFVTPSAASIAADSVDNTKLANMATAKVKARVTAGTGDPEDVDFWQAQPSGAVIGGSVTTYTANANLTTQIPFDDTIPQSTEGTSILTATHTPKSATTKLRIRFRGFGSCGTLGHMTAALFVGTTTIGANAVQVDARYQASADSATGLNIEHEYTPGTTTVQAIQINVGMNNAGGMRMNGTNTARRFGGAASATLVIEEIAP